MVENAPLRWQGITLRARVLSHSTEVISTAERESASPAWLLAEMLVEKLGDLAERDGGLGHAIVEQVLRVRLTFVDLELSFHPGRAERAMSSSAHGLGLLLASSDTGNCRWTGNGLPAY
jgi:hypothetical protein